MHQGIDIIFVGHVSHRSIAAPDIVMGAASRLWNGAAADEDLFVAADTRDGTGQHMCHIKYMRHQIAQGTQTILLFEAPREEAIGVSRVAVEKATVVVGQPSQFACGDELSRILNDRRPAIVVADEGEYSSLVGDGGTLYSFLRVLSNRFLTQDGFPGPGCFADDFQVHTVGGSYVDDLNLPVGDDRVPVGCVALEAKALLGSLRASFYLVGTDDEPGKQSTLKKSIWNGSIGATVNFAHPTHPDHTNTNCTCHDSFLPPILISNDHSGCQ